MMYAGRTSALGLCLFVAACTTYTPKPLLPANSLTDLNSRRLDDPALMQQLRQEAPQYAWPPSPWSLDQLTLAARHIHPEIAQAQAQYQQAKAQLADSEVLPNPQFNYAIQHTGHPPDGQGVWSRGIGLDLLVETAGKRDARQRIAAQDVAIAQMHLVDAEWQLRAQIRDALISLAEAQSSQHYLTAQVAIAHESTEAWEQRVTSGLASRPEYMTAEAHLRDLRQQLSTAMQSETDAKHQLATALGATPVVITQMLFRLPSTAAVTHGVDTQPTAQNLQHRADIQAAIAEYTASEARLQQEVANQYPNLTLSPGYTWDAPSLIWSLAANFTLPLLDRHEHAIKDADAARLVARKQFEALQLTRRNAIDQANKDEAATAQQAQQATDSTTLAHQRQLAMTTAYAAGASDRIQRLEVDEMLVTAQSDEAKSRFAHTRAVAALEDALQTPLSAFQDNSQP